MVRTIKQKNGIYRYQQWPYQITWKQQTIQQFPYKDFLNTLREIDKQEDFLKTMQSYIVETNKPGWTKNNPSFALAAKYFIDELLANNELRGTGGTPTYNFNMVFDALVVSEINGKTKKEKYDKFLKYLQEYQNKFPDIKNNNVYNEINNIILNGYDPDTNCINGTKNGIAKYNTNHLNIYNYNYQNKS